MIRELEKISINQWVDRLMGTPYGFALWRMPEEKEMHLVISLESPKTVNEPIETLGTGFLINAFESYHPPEPYFIKADLQLKEGGVLQISPRVSSSALDAILEARERGFSKKPVEDARNKTHDSNRNDFEEQVIRAVQTIRETELEKVVLAQKHSEPIPEHFDPTAYFERVCDTYPSAFCSLVHIPSRGLWMGATPETLVRSADGIFQTISLAGTKQLRPDQPPSSIAWTQKEIEEQAFVSRYIINCFKKIRLREFQEHGPKTIKAGHLAHLKTIYSVDTQQVGIENLADQMVKMLHPTSAVCGMPFEPALRFIQQEEDFDRHFFTGFLGPVNFKDTTHLFVNLRCAQIHSQGIHFFAGAGITEDSVPAEELKEIEMKMDILRRLL